MHSHAQHNFYVYKEVIKCNVMQCYALLQRGETVEGSIISDKETHFISAPSDMLLFFQFAKQCFIGQDNSCVLQLYLYVNIPSMIVEV